MKLLFLFVAIFTSILQANPIVELTINERANIARTEEPITMGVPLPESLVTDTSVLALTDLAGNQIDCEFRKAAEWLNNSSIKWVHLDFQASVAESGSMKVVLHEDQAKHAPNIKPLILDIITTRQTKIRVFLVPITLRITNMLGKLKAGPASSRARAGPLPMPAPRRPCRIGTSVRVAKYMKAPTTEAKRFAPKELPPTKPLTQPAGIKPSCPGLPSNNPATSTPAKSSGNICLARSQLERNHSSVSPRVVVVSSVKPTIPAEKAISG